MTYQSIPTHPHPEIDKRGGRQEEAAENRNRTQKELATDVALTAAGVGVAGVGRKVAGRAIAAAGLTTADAATTYTRVLQEGTRAAMRDSGVDFTDPKAVASWAKENPEISRQIQSFALQSAGAGIVGKVVGGKAGDFVKNPIGSLAADELVGEGTRKILAPHDPGEQ